MAKYRRAARVDKNQTAIVKTLRKMGFSVMVGHDDILVGYRGNTYWYELKEPEQILTKSGEIKTSALKDSQKKLLQTWKGHYAVVWNVKEIIDDIRNHDNVKGS